MCMRVTVVILSVSHFFIFEKVPFSGLQLTSVQSRFKSCKCSTFFKSELFWRKKTSGTSAVTAVIYVDTAQSLSSLARELLEHITLYQSGHLFRVVALSGKY